MFLFTRLEKILCEFGRACIFLLNSFFSSLLLAVFTAGAGFALLIPLGIFCLARLSINTCFYLVCHIEQAEQSILGTSRLRSDNVRESTYHGELAYTENSTIFRTQESGHFLFQFDGYRQLGAGDRVILRLFRLSRTGRIREYEVLGFAYKL
jgi:hypothetical protein